MASTDAKGLFRFLQRRGYLSVESTAAHDPTGSAPSLKLLHDATPLAAVDTMVVSRAGIIVWKVNLGDMVLRDQLLGEIVNVEDVDAPRTPIVARCDGLVFAIAGRQLCRPGQSIMKIAGKNELEWRKGNLLAL